MYYNIRTNEFFNNIPLNGYLDNGTLVQGLNLLDFDTQKSCGIYPVLSDTPEQPENTIENISERTATVSSNGVAIVRTWTIISTPSTLVPETISARQIRLWLIDNNISLTSIESVINSIVDERLREKTLVEWEYAPYVERHHPLLETLGSALGLSASQIDEAFLQASKL